MKLNLILDGCANATLETEGGQCVEGLLGYEVEFTEDECPLVTVTVLVTPAECVNFTAEDTDVC